MSDKLIYNNLFFTKLKYLIPYNDANSRNNTYKMDAVLQFERF